MTYLANSHAFGGLCVSEHVFKLFIGKLSYPNKFRDSKEFDKLDDHSVTRGENALSEWFGEGIGGDVASGFGHEAEGAIIPN